MISSPLLVGLEGRSLGGSSSGLSCRPTQLCQGGCCGRKAGLVGRVEKVDGLKTSSDPRGSLARGGNRDGDLVDLWSAASISLDRSDQNFRCTFVGLGGSGLEVEQSSQAMMMLTS